MTEMITCSNCGVEIPLGKEIEFDGETLCHNCYEDDTFCCTFCNERFWNDENYGNSDVPLCEECYDDHYTRCSRCGRIILNSEAYYPSDDCDDPYCVSCYDSADELCLRDYGYKPEPIFYGNGSRFFGVELEIDDGGRESEHARILSQIANQAEPRIYVKTDSSLHDGLELATHPMTLEYHRTMMPWKKVMESALSLGYLSHKTTTCGLHIHVNRNCFSTNGEIQDDCIGRVLFFVERFWEEMLRFSRRTQPQMDRWASRYGYKEQPSEILNHAKKGSKGRYTCVNITNYHTIEFRMFRGTLKLNTLIAALQMVNEICNAAVSMSDKQLAALSWCEFMERLNPEKVPELIAYLKERRLYINEPVTAEEDF